MINELVKKGACECCPKTEVQITRRYGNMWMCDDCWNTDQKLTAENSTKEKQTERVNAMLQRASEIDAAISIKSDLFNAATVAILELKAAIDADDTIANKQYELATRLMSRYTHFKTVIFDKRQELLTLENEQRAVQSHLQTLAASLRKEEREKLKLADLSYQPQPVKVTKANSVGAVTKVNSKKLQKEEVEKFSKQYGVNSAIVQMLVVAKNLAPEAAAKLAAETMKK